MRAITAAEFVAGDPEKLAPISGCRCRSCGANAKMRAIDEPDAKWIIVRGAAYCTDEDCLAEALTVRAADQQGHIVTFAQE